MSVTISLGKEEQAALTAHLKNVVSCKIGVDTLDMFQMGYRHGFTAALERLGVKQAAEICAAAMEDKE